MLLRTYYLRHCFFAMKKSYGSSCKGIHKLQQILINTREFQRKYAMKQIKQIVKIRKQDISFDKQTSRNILQNLLTRREKTFLLRSFDRFKACLECNNDIHRTIKSILGKRLGFHIRSYFHTWRQNAQNLEAVDSAKDYGLQRQQLN